LNKLDAHRSVEKQHYLQTALRLVHFAKGVSSTTLALPFWELGNPKQKTNFGFFDSIHSHNGSQPFLTVFN
jgi:hypothetical protein